MILSSVTALAQTSAVRARVTQAVDMQNLVTLRGNVHPLARPEFDQGVAPDDLPMERILLVLQRGADQESALRQLLDDQQVKSSPRYHQWLTPEQFGQQFGPADADIQAVTGWLTTQGFEVNHVAAGRTVIEFSGTAGLVRQVLGTEIHRFRVNGEDYWANTSDPQIPAALAPVVAGLASLNNFPLEPASHVVNAFSRAQATGEVSPLFTVSPGGITDYDLGPTDFATIYNVLPLWNAGIDGTGQTIAIISATDINIQDVRDFRNLFGLPANDPQSILNGPDPGIISTESEADLDVEWSGAVAKGATIDLVVSETTEATQGTALSVLYIVDNNLAPIMSSSYGGCEQFIGAGNNAFVYTTREQGAAEGITILQSAGDTGSARCDQGLGEVAAEYGLTVNGWASTPFNVAVGGTDFADVFNWSQYWNSTNSSPSMSSALSYIPETTWNGSCAASGQPSSCADATEATGGVNKRVGGGGPSTCGIWANGTCAGGYPKPAWQTGPGVPNDGVRDIPDISLFSSVGQSGSAYVVCRADALPAGYPSCQLGTTLHYVRTGGTSAGAPSFAGIMAMVNQKTGGRQGNANYVLYPLAAQPGASCTSNVAAVTNSNCIFYDIVVGNNSVACVADSPSCSNQSGSGYGILVSPVDNSTPAWTTTTGYDLATGLGSVNAANLVNNWTSASFPVALSSTSLTFGSQNVGSPSAPQTVTVTNTGTANLTISTATVSGTNPGDFATSADLCSGATVAPSSTCTINVTFTPSAAGSRSASLIFTDIAPNSPQSVSLSGTGTAQLVSQTINVTTPAPGSAIYNTSFGVAATASSGLTVSFSSGGVCTNVGATFTMTSGTGTCTVKFDQAGNSNYSAATEVTESVTAQQASQTINVTTSAPASAIYNSSFAVAATGGGSGNAVTFSSGGICTNAGATFTMTSGTGTCTVKFDQAGNSNYSAATEVTESVTAQLASQTINVTTPAPASAVYNTSFAVAATGGGSGNAVTFSSGGICTNVGATFTMTSGTGTCTVKFDQAGNSNYSAATEITESVTAQLASQTINVTTPAPASAIYNTSFMVAATASSGLTVSFSSGGICTNVGATFTMTSGTGTCTVKFDQAGNSNYSAAPEVTESVTAQLASQTINVTTPAPASAVYTTSFTVAATASSGLTVSFSSGGVCTNVGATFTMTSGTGTCTVKFDQAGNSNYSAAPEVTESVTAQPAVPVVSLSSSSLTFPAQIVGISSSAQTVKLTNTGYASLAISSISAGGDFSQTNTCGTTVSAGANCTISVTFKPTATGTWTGTVSIWDNAAGSPQSVALSGTGVVFTSGPHPPIVPQPPLEPVPGKPIPGLPPSLPVTEPISVPTPGQAPPTSPPVIGPTSVPAPGQVSPTSPPVTGPASGQATVPAPGVSLAPSALSFSAQLVGTRSSTQTVTLANMGSGTLTLTAIATSANFGQTNNCGGSVAPRGSCTINVTFLPMATGALAGTLTITGSSHGVAGSTQTVTLSGTGVESVVR
jgi:hypothetical protein